jgi:hypothetical protein
MPQSSKQAQPFACEQIAEKIILIRGQRVMLNADLAALFVVTARVLIQAVKRNSSRLPQDFMCEFKQ